MIHVIMSLHISETTSLNVQLYDMHSSSLDKGFRSTLSLHIVLFRSRICLHYVMPDYFNYMVKQCKRFSIGRAIWIETNRICDKRASF